MRVNALLLLLPVCLLPAFSGNSEASTNITQLGEYGLGTAPFIANIQEKLFGCDAPPSASRRRRLVISTTGNSIAAAGYLPHGSQFGDVLAGLLEKRFGVSVEHRNLGVAASNCGYNWMCTQFRGDEDIIIDANPMKWSPRVHSDEACETMVQSELSLRHRPALLSMDVSFPRAHLSEQNVLTSELTAVLKPYGHESLAVVNAAGYLHSFLNSRQRVDSYYHDDIHPSAQGHELLGQLLFKVLVEAACSCKLDSSLPSHWRDESNLVGTNLSVGRGHCVLADAFVRDGTGGGAGVRISANDGWALGHRGVVSLPDATAGVMKDSKYSWMANRPGSAIELTVEASAVSIVYYSNRFRMGSVDAYVDGELVRRIDAYFEGYEWNRTRGLNNMRWLLGKNGRQLNAGEHKIRLVISDAYNKNVIDPQHEFQIIAVLYFM